MRSEVSSGEALALPLLPSTEQAIPAPEAVKTQPAQTNRDIKPTNNQNIALFVFILSF